VRILDLKQFTKWIPIFVLGVLLIVIYRTFDNLGVIFEWGGRLLSLLVPFVIGGAIAFLLLPPCKKFEKLYSASKLGFFAKRARGFAILTVYVIVLGLIAGFISIVVPAIRQSIADFSAQWEQMYAQFIQFMIQFEFFDPDEFMQIFSADNIMETVMNFLNFENIVGFTQGLLEFSMAVISLFIGIAVSIYILIDRDSMYKGVTKIARLYIKPRYLRPLTKYMYQINEFLQRYIYSQLLDSLIMGVSSFIVLTAIGMSYAPVAALLLGLFNIVPYFGSIVATGIAILLAFFSDGATTALWTGVCLIILQQIDANIIQPRLAGRYLNVRPFWIILGILIGGGYFGVMGMFIAPPIVAMVKIIFNDTMERKERRLSKKTKESANESSD